MILPSIGIDLAISQAKSVIDVERSGVINGLFTRWSGLNRFALKYWRFAQITDMAGMSGSGKSAILNMMEDDFTNPLLNPTFLRHLDIKTGQMVGEDKILVLAFKYEMGASDELLRTLSSKVEKSYSYLLSSEAKSEGDTLIYNTVSDEDYKLYCSKLDAMIDRPIRFIESAGNLDQLKATAKYWKEKYPHRRIIITIDHTLLSKKLSEKDDMELTSHTAQVAIELKKTIDAMVIMVSQMNGEIEKPIRRENPKLMFPVKTDIHCGAQLYWACDNVIIWHRPELLGIIKYGEIRQKRDCYAIDATGIIHGVYLKSRFGVTGNGWFKNQFNIGTMSQIKSTDVRFVDKPFNALGV